MEKVNVRQSKVARLLQKEVASIFQTGAKDLFQGKIISVTAVRVSADLSIARVYLSIFPLQVDEDYIGYINQQTKIIRNQLGRIIRHQVRIIPELHFFRDDSIDYANRIDELLK